MTTSVVGGLITTDTGGVKIWRGHKHDSNMRDIYAQMEPLLSVKSSGFGSFICLLHSISRVSFDGDLISQLTDIE